MKTLFSKLFISLSFVLLLTACAALKNNTTSKPIVIEASIDLVNINDDKERPKLEPMNIPILDVL